MATTEGKEFINKYKGTDCLKCSWEIMYNKGHITLEEFAECAELTEQEIANYKEKQIDICTLKKQKIQESKEQLATWLANNPMESEIHNPEGEFYTVTQDKQTQLTQLLTLYSMAKQAGGEMQLTWNCTGGVCEEWTYEELSTLSFQIAEYVLPRVKKQQTLEVQINECCTVEEVEKIEIEYETIS